MKNKFLTIFMTATFTSGLIAPVVGYAATEITSEVSIENVQKEELNETEATSETSSTEETSTTETTEETTVETTTSESSVEESTSESTSTEESTIQTTTESSKTEESKKPETSTTSSTKEKPKPKPAPTKNKPTESTPKESVHINETSDVVLPTGEEESSFVSTTDIKFIKNQTTEDFIESIGDKAREIGQEYDLYASVMIAQAILETGSGNSELSQAPNHNLFGIKGSYKGQSVSYNTSEDNGKGSLYTIKAEFRKYPGYKESFEDYAELLTDTKKGNGDFYKGTWKKNAKTYQEATKSLTGKYATDTSYDQKLNKLIETYDLTFFDKKLDGDAKIQNIYYDVKPGDTIDSIIAEKTVDKKEFLNWNKKLVDEKKALTEGQRVIVGQRKISSYKIKNLKSKEVSEFIIPLKEGYSISSPFGARDSEHHNGIDMAVAENTLIYASSDGKVVAKGFDPSAGNYVILQHENGLFTSYFHMNRSSVGLDEKVKMGDMIGYVGSTGNSTGAHLHFAINTELWSGYINPANYMNFN
ncbi:glucosaminidase domain-containing protein [Vagococcus hydrophili]|uniref:Peptidoglycan hydrolase n=1 Tax=Vagococcus hydrophili TaxID=2714947 RepID=A0A6G8AQX8_9ENTE|nr:glucosaminidase domain-containing protein [Vagococcus hydrophili]QIL47333.1 peptidoglycan DD-metalloendopeptidase family protein [Vagococcus hydrophili]